MSDSVDPVPAGYCKDLLHKQQARFRENSPTISDAARRRDDPAGRRHGHLLARGCEEENLFPSPLPGSPTRTAWTEDWTPTIHS